VRSRNHRWPGRFVALVLVAAAATTLVSCAGVLSAIEDRLPPPSEVDGGILFRYYAPSARQVTVAGNFNNWGGTQGGGRYDPAIDPMGDSDNDGVWSIVMPLPPGRYQYKYVVDGGVKWERDPNNPDTAYEGGIENSLLIVAPGVRYDYEVVTGTRIAGETVRETNEAVSEVAGEAGAIEVALEFEAPDARKVFVAGEFNQWNPDSDEMTKGDDGVFRITLELEPGTYEYKFVVDGTWVEDPGNPDSAPDPYGGANSILTVE